MTVNLTKAPHTETPALKFGLCKLGIGWFLSKFLFKNKTYLHPFIFLRFRNCINITKRIVNIQFKVSFRPTLLYINRLEGQVHVHRQKATYTCFYLYLYIYILERERMRDSRGCVAIIHTQTHNGYSMQTWNFKCTNCFLIPIVPSISMNDNNKYKLILN